MIPGFLRITLSKAYLSFRDDYPKFVAVQISVNVFGTSVLKSRGLESLLSRALCLQPAVSGSAPDILTMQGYT
jgi:hypothetical protein